MAYNNNGGNINNKNKKKPSNYFINNIERLGENFLEYKNSKDIYFDCPSIFRQLGKRQIELDKYGHFFFDIPFLDGCITACNQRANFYGWSFNGMYAMIEKYKACGQAAPQEIIAVSDTHLNAWRAYNTIHYYLYQMRLTGNIQFLYRLADILYTNQILRNSIL